MLRRKVYDSLMEWRSSEGHKPLLVRGQRQVGKTYIIREFAKTYDHSIEVDLSKNARVREAFFESSSVDEVLEALILEDSSFDPVPGKTLIFLDEIQSCPSARASLKLFGEDGRFDVVASGSLIGVRRGKGKRETGEEDDGDPSPLVPVGYEKHLRMYALDFEEFLWAKGFREDTIEKVRKAVREGTELRGVVLKAFDDAFREYMMVGGMPEAVQTFVDGATVREVSEKLGDIVLSTYDDMAKYNDGADVLKIRSCFDSIPFQLSGTNKKFMYTRIGGNGSRSGSRVYGDALLWIGAAGVGNLCHALKAITRPVSISRKTDGFKVYLSDTGMLIRLMDGDGSAALSAVRRDDLSFNEGAITENVVAECLMKAGIQRNYYIKRSGKDMMELDFVVDLGSEVAVIEVKSGKDRSSPSLRKTVGDGRFQRWIMFERGNIRVDVDGVEHYPLFAAAFVRDMIRDDGALDEVMNSPVPEGLRAGGDPRRRDDDGRLLRSGMQEALDQALHGGAHLRRGPGLHPRLGAPGTVVLGRAPGPSRRPARQGHDKEGGRVQGHGRRSAGVVRRGDSRRRGHQRTGALDRGCRRGLRVHTPGGRGPRGRRVLDPHPRTRGQERVGERWDQGDPGDPGRLRGPELRSARRQGREQEGVRPR